MTQRSFHKGDPQTFALKIRFEPDPDRAKGASKEESLSWGALELWVNGRNLCVNQSAGEIHHEVRWYLLPIFEWLVTSWDAILHEERLGSIARFADARTSYLESVIPDLAEFSDKRTAEKQDNWHQWWRRHALRSHRDGGLLPDLFIRRWRDSIEFSWGNAGLPGAPEDFLFLSPQGVVRLDLRTVVRTLYECLGEVIRYLLSLDTTSQRMQKLSGSWQAIRNTPPSTREAWLAKLGTSLEDSASLLQVARAAIRNDREDIISAVFGTQTDDGLVITEESQATRMFGTVAPDVSKTDVRRLTRLIASSYSEDGDGTRLGACVKDVPIATTSRPWVQGYELAQEYLKSVRSYNGKETLDIASLVSKSGISTSDIDVADSTVRGVTVAGPRHHPTIFINQNCSWNASAAGRRFTIAHELCHLLYDRAHGHKVAMASGPWAPRDMEQRANAFAAMLLMPLDSINKAIRRLDVPVASVEGIHRIAETHQTSTLATIEHLYNLQKIDDADREKLRSEFEAVLTSGRRRPGSRQHTRGLQ